MQLHSHRIFATDVRAIFRLSKVNTSFRVVDFEGESTRCSLRVEFKTTSIPEKRHVQPNADVSPPEIEWQVLSSSWHRYRRKASYFVDVTRLMDSQPFAAMILVAQQSRHGQMQSMSRRGGILESIPEVLDRGFQSSGILSEGDKRDINGTLSPGLSARRADMPLVGAIWLRSQHLGLGLGESGLPSCQHSLRAPRSECPTGRSNALIMGWPSSQRATAGRASGEQPRFTSRCFQLLATEIPGWKGEDF